MISQINACLMVISLGGHMRNSKLSEKGLAQQQEG